MADLYRLALGQNRPLTPVFVSGGEHASAPRDGVATVTGTWSYDTAAPSPHQRGGSGGSRYRRGSTGGATDSFLGMPNLEEFVVALALYTGASDQQLVIAQESAGPTIQTRLQVLGSTGTLNIQRGTVTQASSAAAAIPLSQWNWIHSWQHINNSGFCHVRLGSYANVIATFTGDTQAHASFAYANQLAMQNAAGSVGATRYDDFHVFARSLYWSGGSGSVPVAGATITDGTTGGTCVVTHVQHDGAGTGVFFIKTVTGTVGLGNTISSGGWSATADNSQANDEDHLWVPELYHLLGTTSADDTVGITNTTAGGGAHYTEVADSANDATFVSSSTADQLDVYATTITLPPGAEAYVLAATARARLNGVSAADQVQLGVDDGVAAVDSLNYSPLSGSYEEHQLLLGGNPNTGERYEAAEIAALKLRLRLRA